MLITDVANKDLVYRAWPILKYVLLACGLFDSFSDTPIILFPALLIIIYERYANIPLHGANGTRNGEKYSTACISVNCRSHLTGHDTTYLRLFNENFVDAMWTLCGL